MPSYRAIHLGGDNWAVRRFGGDGCHEVQFVFHVDDPQLRSSDRAVIAAAQSRTDWRKV